MTFILTMFWTIRDKTDKLSYILSKTFFVMLKCPVCYDVYTLIPVHIYTYVFLYFFYRWWNINQLVCRIIWILSLYCDKSKKQLYIFKTSFYQLFFSSHETRWLLHSKLFLYQKCFYFLFLLVIDIQNSKFPIYDALIIAGN